MRRNHGASVTGVECRAFRLFGRRACPQTPHSLLWQASPETPHLALISLTSGERRERMLTSSFTKNHAKNPERTKGMVNYNRERKRILLVEGEEDATELVARILAGYTLTCARNFDEGLLAARREYFDLY